MGNQIHPAVHAVPLRAKHHHCHAAAVGAHLSAVSLLVHSHWPGRSDDSDHGRYRFVVFASAGAGVSIACFYMIVAQRMIASVYAYTCEMRNTNAHTHTHISGLSITATVDAGTSALKTDATWQRSSGELRIDLEEDPTSSAPMGAGQVYTISFLLSNPATPQASDVEIIVATPLVTVSANMDAEQGKNVPHNIWNAVDGDFQPLYVRDVELVASAKQSSPFPCDTNIITVAMTPNVDLIRSCAPRVTLAGLISTPAPASNQLSVSLSLLSLGQSQSVSKGAVDATWDYTTGIYFFSVWPAFSFT